MVSIPSSEVICTTAVVLRLLLPPSSHHHCVYLAHRYYFLFIKLEGIPDDRKLKEGDVVNVDITVYLDGYHGDCSEMFAVGELDAQARALIQATYDCWIKACQFVQPGRDYKELGAIMENHIEPLGFSSVRNFCGHGIGSV